jgi:penicillin-binding protein 1A
MTKDDTKDKILQRRARKSGRGPWRWLKWLTLVALFGLLLALGAALGGYFHYSRDLPRITSLRDYHPATVTTVYADDNTKIGEFYKERRIVVPLEKIPEQLKQAFIAAEDARFYKHSGIDLVSIVRAFFKNLEAGAASSRGAAPSPNR